MGTDVKVHRSLLYIERIIGETFLNSEKYVNILLYILQGEMEG